jgi:predicted transcriptional regulator
MAEIADMLMVDQNEVAKVLRALAARCASQERELAERDDRILELLGRVNTLEERCKLLHEVNDENLRVREARTRRAEAAERSLAAMLERESVIYDGHRVLAEVKANAKAAGRTSPENVSDVLDAIARIWKEPT